jgi:hypothetical protein
MGKGSNRRPCLVSQDELDLRWDLLQGKITREQFDKNLSELNKPQAAIKLLGDYVEQSKLVQNEFFDKEIEKLRSEVK